MQYWSELRTAFMLARHGTVSAAAEALGVHRATVNRHVDTLEAEFRAKLFQRHARGYTLTESGQEMLDVVGRVDEMFTDLAGRNRGRSATLSGNLIVTAMSSIAPLITPAIREFHLAHPRIDLEFAASTDLARLEHGEAHIAFRAGPKPDTPDYVVRLFRRIRFGLYASRSYADQREQLTANDLTRHSFVGSLSLPSRLPFAQWMKTHVRAEDFSLLTTDPNVILSAIKDGIGVGFLAEFIAYGEPDLIEMKPSAHDWFAPIWVVTHVDLHRTEKVQQFLRHIQHTAPRNNEPLGE